MSAENKKALFVTILVWIGIIGLLAFLARLWILPAMKQKRDSAMVQQTSSPSRYKAEVTLAADAFSGYCILRSDEMGNRLRKQGIKLSIIDDKADYLGRLTQVQQGSVPMAVFTVDSLIKAGSKLGEIPVCIVYIIDETRGADAIVANSNTVTRIADLNNGDARIVLTPDSPSEFLARTLLASFDLARLPEKWWIEAEGAADVLKRFRTESGKRRAAYVVWQPYVSKALREPGAHVLLDSSRLKGFIVDVLVAQREFLVSHYAVVKMVVEAYARTAYAYRDPGRMAALVVQDARVSGGEQLSDREATDLVKGIQWKNTMENYAHFGLLGATEAQGLDSIEDIIVKVTDVLITTSSIKQDPAKGQPNTLFFDRILREMKAESFHPGRELNLIPDAGTGGAESEAVRGDGELRALTDEQWRSLMPVGELRVEPISFGRGNATLSVQGRHELRNLARTLKSWPHYYLTVAGRARPEGDAEANRALAQARAEAALQILVAEGVSASRIRTQAAVRAEGGGEAQSVTFAAGQIPY